MTKEEIVENIVLLDEYFITNAHDDVDIYVPTKPARPYLILELKYDNEMTLFAVPIQTNVSKSIPAEDFEKLPKRLDTRINCDCGLLFGQMVPITPDFVIEKKGADNHVPDEDEKQDIIYKNFKLGHGDVVPERVRALFPKSQYLVRQLGMPVFQNKEFQQKYKTMANAIFEDTLKIKDEKIDIIRAKAQNYLDKYQLFLNEVVKKKNKNFFIRMPRRFTRINKLIEYLQSQNKTNVVQSSTQVEQPNQPALNDEVDAVAKKFGISREEVLEIKGDSSNKIPLEDVVEIRIGRSPDGKYNPATMDKARAEFEAKLNEQLGRKPVAVRHENTQEKINNQQPVVAKPKRKDSDYNCR